MVSLSVVKDNGSTDVATAYASLPLTALVIGDDFRLDEDLEGLQGLADSIKELGVLQPLLVRHKGDVWEVVAGRRRLAASRLAGLETVPCFVSAASSERSVDATLAENLHRRNLSPVEEALAYARLKEEQGLTQKAIGEKVGRSQSHVGMHLRLLDLPAEVQSAVHQGKLSYVTALRSRNKKGKRQGGGDAPPIYGGSDVLASHWRRRHDRLMTALTVLYKAHPENVPEYRAMIDRVRKLDSQPLD